MTQSQQPRCPMFTEFCLEEDSIVALLYHYSHSNAFKQNVMHMTTACCNNIIVLLKHPNSVLTVG